MSQLQEGALEAILNRAGTPMELASFQVRATENILQRIYSSRSSGTIVCAGTGSGKTISFYLTCFLNDLRVDQFVCLDSMHRSLSAK